MALAQDHLKVFISSKQTEFEEERKDIYAIVERLPLLAPNAAEYWGAEKEAVRRVSIREAGNCAIYIGLFGCVYSDPAIDEFNAARKNPHRELLIYIRNCPKRDPQLAGFIDAVEHPMDGCTVIHYPAWEYIKPRFETHLWGAVGRMVRHLLALAAPPVAMDQEDRGLGRNTPARRVWEAEKASLLNLGLPEDPSRARALGDLISDRIAARGHSIR